MYADIKLIRKTNERVYATATVVLELLGYKFKNMHREEVYSQYLSSYEKIHQNIHW